jgi:glucose-6-phosphate 1-epimerase
MSSLENLLFQGLPAVRLCAHDGSTATLTLHGAHLVSWTTPDGVERLYLSPRSHFGTEQAIRGGVPVIFPQFSTRGPLARHGFARTSVWSVVDAPTAPALCSVTLRLQSSAATRAVWPVAFVCDLTVALDQGGLSLDMEVRNTGVEPFSFQAALHSYFAVDRMASLRIAGLDDCAFEDCAQTGVDGTMDRIYFNAPQALELHSELGALALQQQGFCDVVVWNPGNTGPATVADLPVDGYQHFVCIEAAKIGDTHALEPGQRWAGSHSFQLQ